MRENLVKWIKADARRKWIHNIAWEMLYKKGILVDDYLDSLIQPGFKIDELGLVIYARMYHIGIGIILQIDFWTTRTNDSPEDCDAVLCFYGNLKFSDTRLKISEVINLTVSDKDKPSQTKDTKCKTSNSLKSDLNSEEDTQVLYEQMHGKQPVSEKLNTPSRPKSLSPPPEKVATLLKGKKSKSSPQAQAKEAK